MAQDSTHYHRFDHSLPALTGLRGMAAIWVLLYHAWVYATPQEILLEWFGPTIRLHVLFSLGWAGVQVLFVLSGFLLTLPYARANAGLSARPRLGRYILRRIARVFPAYYLQLSILLVVSLATFGTLLVDWPSAIQYLLMLFVPPPIGVGAPAGVNGVWWTLPIELSFYLVLPVVASLASQHRKMLLVALSLLSMITWRYFVVSIVAPASEQAVWSYQLPGSMDSFGLGMLGAVIHVQYTQTPGAFSRYANRLRKLLLATPLVLVGLFMWMDKEFASYWSGAPIHYLWTPIFASTALVIILNCAVNCSLLNALLANRVIYYLGTVSYGLYLWHYPIGNWLLHSPLVAGMEGYPFPRLALLMFLLSLLAASVSWHLVEARAIALAKGV